MYRCVECGHVFEEGEQMRYTESHGEKFSVCPACGGGYETAYNCDECGNVLSEDECFEGLCAECLSEKICYGTALNYFKSRGIVVDFMLDKWYESTAPANPSEKLVEAMEENFRREAANELLLNRDQFITAIKQYIMDDDGNMGKQDFAEWLTKEGSE